MKWCSITLAISMSAIIWCLYGMEEFGRVARTNNNFYFELSLIPPSQALQQTEIITTYPGVNPYLSFITLAPNFGYYGADYPRRPCTGIIQLRPDMIDATIPESIQKNISSLSSLTTVDYTISFWGPCSELVKDLRTINLIFHPWARTWALTDPAVRFNPQDQDIYFNVNVSMGLFEPDGVSRAEKNSVPFGTLAPQSVSVHGPGKKIVTAQAARFQDKQAAKDFLNKIASQLNRFEDMVHETAVAEYKKLENIDSTSTIVSKKVRTELLKVKKAPVLQTIQDGDLFWVVYVTKIVSQALPPAVNNFQLLFSPNNARFLIDETHSLSSFWTVAHSPDKKNLCISYIVLINSQSTQEILNTIFMQSKDLADLIKNLHSSAGFFMEVDTKSLLKIADTLQLVATRRRVPSLPIQYPPPVQPNGDLQSECAAALYRLERALVQLQRFL